MNLIIKRPQLPDIDVVLPNEIAGLTYAGEVDYAKMHGMSSEAMDVGFKYKLADIAKADIFVYAYTDENANHPTNAAELISHYFNCVNEVLRSDGNYRSYVRLISQQLLQVQDHQYLTSWFVLQDDPDDDPLHSLMALTVVGGYFLKIRYSSRLTDPNIAASQDGLDDKMMVFLTELTSHLGKSDHDKAGL
ncbi:hypothetical protein KQI52_08740 [bacterium]|nr:hypothetical protein [bacterium]